MTMGNVDLTKSMSELKKSQAAVDAVNGGGLWSPELVKFLSLSLLGFTLLALLICAVLLWRSRAPGAQILRIFGVLSIIGVSALLLVVGYDNDQLTPIIGLFGAIAGYLLGKDSDSNSRLTPPREESTKSDPK